MFSQPQLVFELAVLGMGVGLLSGLLGIGGAMVMVPALTFILTDKGYPHEYTVKAAVATSLATICFTSLSSVRAHHRRGAVRWDIWKVLAPGILVGSLAGAQGAVALPGNSLGLLFAVFVAFSATQMLVGRKPGAHHRPLPGAFGTFAAGTVIGVASALVGAGGAFVSVPFLTWCNVGIHEAVATSAALGFPIALAGTIGYLWAGRELASQGPGTFGYLYLPGLLFISLASVVLAPLGARIAHSLDVKPLRRGFAVMLYGVSLYFFLR
ncbi:MAG TPA: sulfite exporter TauE/SafE family protein [Ramlibacter sp.]|uniref:sulfite exporter TauE/SafE family protein n=1 Tax=Ramlibacter sp. TaxID=1917967 RepID=UPI002C3D2050|nr:sulfite exporter TauE/SafE family protein [Ramlibacter sp.]HVZ44733.1 sulfite exporter TauE/SafE family protein [Ramlibacter sp.]